MDSRVKKAPLATENIHVGSDLRESRIIHEFQTDSSSKPPVPLKADKNHEINFQKTQIKHLKKVVPYQMDKMRQGWAARRRGRKEEVKGRDFIDFLGGPW